MTAKAKVLLVEDDNDLRDSLAEVLELEGYELNTAASAEEAIELLEGGAVFDLIISDHYMRNRSGIDLLRFVRAHNPVRPAFFLITGQSEISRTIARTMGAQEFILKPFEITELFDLIEKHLAHAPWIAGSPEG
jgi:two-component system response regulator CpxR